MLNKKYIILVNFLLLFGCCWAQECTGISVDQRIDCAPEKAINKTECTVRKCCFVEPETPGANDNKHIPTCFMPKVYPGYKVKGIIREYAHLIVNLERQTPSGFPNDIKSVFLEITLLDNLSLRLRFTDTNNKRYEPPIPQIKLPEFPAVYDPVYIVDVTQEGLLTIQRKSTKKLIFQTDLTKLIYSDQFIQLKSTLPSPQIYGLGENKSNFTKSTQWELITIFNHDKTMSAPGPRYGSHPFYLNIEDVSTGTSNGVFLLNSNAMDVLLQPEPAITYRPIGGILDMFVFLGPKPDDVVRQYIHLIGLPELPPFWALGYHQCRCCTEPHTLANQKLITERTISAGIPFDVQWNAKEYMEPTFDDFTIDQKRFGGFADWVRHLHDIGMHYVPIVDPGIDPAQKAGQYAPYDDGVSMDIFIKNNTGGIFIGKTWQTSGKTVYPDFSHPGSIKYWTKQYQEFHNQVPIDGSWNDMNEVDNFLSASIYGCPANNSLETPPYLPKQLPKIQDQTLCMSAKQYAGLHYNVHNLYAFYMAIATDEALKTVRNKRPFVISRATSPGQGKYSGHWNGDTDTTYGELKWTIGSVLDMNMFGIPLAGGDICGFMGHSENNTHGQELCARWLEVGAFYPFSRNHNTKKMDQDPVALGTMVTRAAKNALSTRYTLLPYLYTLFYHAKTNGDTVSRPLFFEYPADKNTYERTVAETQFMWGSAFMVAPVTQPNITKINAYLPEGVWYPFSHNKVGKPIASTGEYMEFEAPVDEVNTFLRGGNVVPRLPVRQTTTAMRTEKFTLMVVPDVKGEARGQLYWDDGDSIGTIESGNYTLVTFDVKNATLVTNPQHNEYAGGVTTDTIHVLGVNKKPTTVTIDGQMATNVTYSQDPQWLSVYGLTIDLGKSKHTVEWK